MSKPTLPFTFRFLVPAFLLGLAACAGGQRVVHEGPAGAPHPALIPQAVPVEASAQRGGHAVLWEPELVPFHLEVRTDSELAQRWFDQGMLLSIGFNHDEGVRSFRMARTIDPECAMAWWGEAYALGPNINLPFEDPAVAQQAYDAAQQALSLQHKAKPAHQALIVAMAARYGDPKADGFVVNERAELDEAFAQKMQQAWNVYGTDPMVGAVFADALLNLHPWETWTKDGQPMHRIRETQAVLERVAVLDPDHPFGNHLYIHAIEAAPHKRKALRAARSLGRYAPAMGHLVHMPSHILIQTGNYIEAEMVNTAAVQSDRAYFQAAGPQGIYEFYRVHNHHFRCYGAMFAGRSRVAVTAAQELISDMPPAVLNAMAPFIDGFLPVVQHARLRFGMWEDVLAAEMPDERFPLARTMWHYARGVALAATGRVSEAAVEQAAFFAARDEVPEGATFGINPAPPVLAVAEHMLEGELRYRMGEYDAAFTALRKAVELEDAVRYDEPSPWMQPVRHALAALLLEQGHVQEAEEVYQADLKKHPENGWSLFGLMECARKRGDSAAEEALRARFEAAWAHADFPLAASCACANGVAASMAAHGAVDLPTGGGDARASSAECCGK